MKQSILLPEPAKLKTPFCFLRLAAITLACGCIVSAFAQTPGDPPPREGDSPPFGDVPPQFRGPRGRGPGGFGGVQEKQQVVQQFDKDGDQRLNAAERQAALEFLQKEQAEGRGRRGPRGPGGRGGFGGPEENQEPTQPGPKLSPEDVKSFPSAPVYDAQTLRTFFLEFEDAHWEKELASFKNTDIEVPAKLTVDGKTYLDVGVHFRGMSSFMMVGEGRKRSLNLSLDFVHKDQQIGGYRTLNLLNSHEDPTFLRSVLFYDVAREYIPAPKANFARVVINGESWGVYVNVEQFNKDFVKEWFGTKKGARWKVPGSPNGRGSLAYLGDDAAAYRRIYEIKSKDDAKSWADLIRLCKVLKETPPEKLVAALEPILDVDGALRFLALDNALINDDGYWIRTSDYSIYEDEKGRFHIIPQDANETFSRPGGPGFGSGPGGPRGGGGRGGFGPAEARPRDGIDAAPPQPNFGGPNAGPGVFAESPDGRPPGRTGMGGGANIKGVELDPLFAANDESKPLISKLLAVPSLRARHLAYVRDIAEKWLDWNKLGPIAERYHSLIAAEVKADTRKLESTEAFIQGLTKDVRGGGGGPPGGGGTIGLKNFADQRRVFLLNLAEAKKPESSPEVNQ
jgi:hypothetical protein